MVIFAGPQVAGSIRNQFNTVTDTLDEGTSGNAFKNAVDVPDPQNGTAFAVYSEDDHSLMFYKRRGVPQVGDMFYNCRSIQFLDLSSFDTTDMNIGCAFHDCVSLKTVDLSGWVVSSATRLDYMFCGCRSLATIKGDIEHWDVSNVNDMTSTFDYCRELKIDCSDWNVSRVSKYENFSRDAFEVVAPHWASKSTI